MTGHKLKGTEHFQTIVGKQVYDGYQLYTIKNLGQLITTFPTPNERGMDIIDKGVFYGKLHYLMGCGEIQYLEVQMESGRYILAYK